MKNLILLAVLLLNAIFIKAQIPPIMVCNPAGTSCAPYKTLDDAYNASNAGDHIYLPGGNFSLSVPIKKEIHIVGAGFEPNGTPVTGVTNIAGDLILGNNDGSNVNNCSFEGFYLTGNILTKEDNVTGLIIDYCNINALTPLNITGIETINNSRVMHSVVRDYLNFSESVGGVNNIIANNIIYSGVLKLINSSINNNIIGNRLAGYSCGWSWCAEYASVLTSVNTVVKNNIINNGGYSSANLSFLNNINTGNNFVGAIVNQNNISNQLLEDTFVNSTVLTYSNANDYHLKSTSPGKNAGDDGTDIGIYGGSTPWKENAIPSNPHIYFKNIGNTVDGSGNLPVQIKVSAQ